MEIEGYKILQTIGRGGMGVVYLARDLRLDRLVALKVLPQRLCSRPGFRARFLREVHVLARLKHANLVPVFEGGIHGRNPHYSMGFIQGKSLFEVLRFLRARRDQGVEWFTGKALAEAAGLPYTAPSYLETVLWWILDLAGALAYVHQKGVLHLDLKPSNVMITPEGKIVLLDFGVAQLLHEGRGEFFGSPSYMAPERMLSGGKYVGEFSDAYSLAVLLFELLTLELPVPGKSIPELSRNHRNGVLRDPLSLQGNLPLELAQILRKALAKEPSVSYLDVPTFAEDLRKFLDFEPLKLPGIPLRIHLLRLGKRWRKPLLRWGGGLVLGLCVLFLFLFGSRWRAGASQAEKVEEVQGFSFLRMAREALGRLDLALSDQFLRLARGASRSPSLVREALRLQGLLDAERERGLRLLQEKVRTKEGEGIEGLVERLRPVVPADSPFQTLLAKAVVLGKEESRKKELLSQDPHLRKLALLRLACDLSKGLVQEGGRMQALRQILGERSPPEEAFLCLWAGGWDPWKLQLQKGVGFWETRAQLPLLFLLAFDRREPFATWVQEKNRKVFTFRWKAWQFWRLRILDLADMIKEAKSQGATKLLPRLKCLRRFLDFYQLGAFHWPGTEMMYFRTSLFYGLQLRLAWGLPLEDEEALALLRRAGRRMKLKILWTLFWSRSGPPSEAFFDAIGADWRGGIDMEEAQILSLLGRWCPRRAWLFFQELGLAHGSDPGEFAFFLSCIPPELSKGFREEVLADPVCPQVYREGVFLYQLGVQEAPLLPQDLQACDPRILPDALVLIAGAGEGEVPLLRRLERSTFPVVRRAASHRIQSLEGK